MSSAKSHRRTPSILRVRAAEVPANSLETSPLSASSAVEPYSLLSPSTADLPPASGPPPPSSQKSSEKVGFVVFASSLVAWYLYLTWAFLPDRYLWYLGITWYPSREWAILVPSWIMMEVVFVYIAYFAINLYNTPPLDHLSAVTDSHAHLAPKHFLEPESGPYYVSEGSDDIHPDYIAPLYDLPAGRINRAIFEDG